MGTNHRADSAVEVEAKGLFLAGGLGMHVDEDVGPPWSSASTASIARKGSSRARMKTRPCTLITVSVSSPTRMSIHPRPGAPGG